MSFIAPLIIAAAAHPVAALAIGAATAFAGKTILGRTASSEQSLLSQPATLPAAPTFEQAQGTSIMEQREKLRQHKAGGGTTNLTGGNLLSPINVYGKTLLGS